MVNGICCDNIILFIPYIEFNTSMSIITRWANIILVTEKELEVYNFLEWLYEK